MLQSATSWLKRRWYIPVLLAVLYVYEGTWRWTSGSWLATQAAPLPDVLLASPIPEGHVTDVNFWFGHMFGIFFICLLTYFVLNSQELWEGQLLPLLFTKQQINLLSFLFLRQVQNVVFMFISQQVRRCFRAQQPLLSLLLSCFWARRPARRHTSLANPPSSPHSS